jgi:GrpB-like predicted nucleotidyltransferase (UPF0157 family)
MLGLPRGTVQLVPYTAAWAELFQQECARLQDALGSRALDIQHIGSTAVPGLAAKPILDIGIAVADLAVVPECVSLMEALGYTYRGDREQRGDHLFVKGPEQQRTHYVHMLRASDPTWHDYLRFRDHLIAHPAARDAYMQLKERLAAQYADNRGVYTEAKANLIQQILAAAQNQGVR